MPEIEAKIAGYKKTLAVPPFNAVMGRDGLLYQKSTYGQTVTTVLGTSDYTLVPGVAGSRLYVTQLAIFAPTLTLRYYLRDTANADMFGSAAATIALTSTGLVLPPSEVGWFRTGVGAGIKLTVPTGLAVGSFYVSLAYVAVADTATW